MDFFTFDYIFQSARLKIIKTTKNNFKKENENENEKNINVHMYRVRKKIKYARKR